MGKIIDVDENGYLIGDKILRYPKFWLKLSVKEDYYKILGLDKNASDSEIKKRTWWYH